MVKILILSAFVFILTISFGCGSPPVAQGRAASPTEAFKLLYQAVKAKDTDAIKSVLSKRSIAFGKMSMTKYGKTEQEAFATGFTATTYSATMPEFRDERVKDNMGALEVWNSKESRWEDLPFVLEDGGWKMAFGDQFAGTYKSPGEGRDAIEKEASNTKIVVPGPTVDANAAEHAPKLPPPVMKNINKP